MAGFPYPEKELIYSSASSVNGHEFISLLETQTDNFGVGLELESFIRTDNKQAFVSFLKDSEFYFDVHFDTRLLKLLCFRRAIDCTTALLNGETGLPRVDLNRGLPADPLEDEVGDNPTPLQLSAKMLCYGLTKLFIQHGADLSYTFLYHPLNLALDSFCDHKIVKDFDAGESVYRLFSLFRLQELKEPFETIKLLASLTKQQEVLELGLYCVEKWNLVKLAALLIVAWDKLEIDDDIYCDPIVKLIVLQQDLESDLEKKEVMKSMLHALRLVEMSRYYLKENHTISMVEVANNLLAEVKLHDKGTHMVSADLDRSAVQLLRRNKEFCETALAGKNCSNAPLTRVIILNYMISADVHRCTELVQLGEKVILETRLMKKMRSKSMNTECIYFLSKSPGGDLWEVKNSSFYQHLYRAMRLDDRYEFVKVVNRVESFDSLGCEYNLPTLVRKLMFLYDSANCAAAVLAGETDAFLKFRDLTDVGWPFLHNAAKLANPKLTALFLEKGFLADDRRDCDELKMKAALPLNVALESIRDDFNIQQWKKNESASGLVVLLCRDKFRNILETIRLLVLKTKNVYSEFSLYLKEEKLVEVCALLMVAHKEILASDFIVDTLVPTSITRKAGVAGHMRHFSTSTEHGNSHEHIDPLQKKEMPLLLAIFGKMGDYLSAYIRLEQIKNPHEMDSEVKWLIDNAGISDALVSKIANTMFRISADHERVSGRVYHNSLEQHGRPKLLAGSRNPNKAAMSMAWTRGSSSMAFASAFHTLVPKINADFAPLVSAKRLVDVSGRRHPAMRCMSIVAAFSSGFRRM